MAITAVFLIMMGSAAAYFTAPDTPVSAPAANTAKQDDRSKIDEEVSPGEAGDTENQGDSEVQTTPSPAPAGGETAKPPAPAPAPAANVNLYYTDTGFSQLQPISAGTVVNVVNNSSKILNFYSDPEGAHDDNPELNIGQIEPGASAKFTAMTIGTWGFHNHSDTADSGSIFVK